MPELRDKDIAYQAMRASGPGGQHVDRTDSAVRATHLPTGLTAFSQEQRSQFANRKIARLKLAMLFEQRAQDATSGRKDMWAQNRELERGNEVRTYRGEKFVSGKRFEGTRMRGAARRKSAYANSDLPASKRFLISVTP